MEATRKQLVENELNTAKILQDYTAKSRAQFEKYIREEVKEKIGEHLLQQGESAEIVMALLDVPARFVESMVRRLGQQKVGSANAWLRYDEQEGRNGYVILHHGKSVNRFAYELGGTKALAVIEIPTASQWELHTGLPLAERELILEFVGTQMVADQAPGYKYRIGNDSIVIY